MLALLACNSPLIHQFPRWAVIVPAAICLFLIYIGITLLRAPVDRQSPPNPYAALGARIAIGLAALGGLILTSYFHGDSPEDRQGIALLQKISVGFLILTPFLLVSSLTSIWRGRKAKADAPASTYLP